VNSFIAFVVFSIPVSAASKPDVISLKALYFAMASLSFGVKQLKRIETL